MKQKETSFSDGKGLTINSYFVAFVALSVLFLVLMNLFAMRPIGWGDFMLTNAGLLLIAPVMVLQNIITEIWGKKTAFRVTIFAVCCQLIVVALSQIVILLPTNHTEAAENWASVFGSQWRIVTASIAAFIVGSLLNILIFAKIRDKSRKAKGKYKVLYTIAAVFSTAVAQFIDSTIFMVLAFAPVGIPGFELSWINIWTSVGIGTIVQLALETTLVVFIAVHIAKQLKKKKEAEENIRRDGNSVATI